jgi:hypothetical protein
MLRAGLALGAPGAARPVIGYQGPRLERGPGQHVRNGEDTGLLCPQAAAFWQASRRTAWRLAPACEDTGHALLRAAIAVGRPVT